MRVLTTAPWHIDAVGGRPPQLLSNSAEMLWRHYRREVTHCELFGSVDRLLEATRDFFDRMNRTPERTAASSRRPRPGGLSAASSAR